MRPVNKFSKTLMIPLIFPLSRKIITNVAKTMLNRTTPNKVPIIVPTSGKCGGSAVIKVMPNKNNYYHGQAIGHTQHVHDSTFIILYLCTQPLWDLVPILHSPCMLWY